MPDYDVIIIGAGAAGLSLATALVESSWQKSKILLIDPDLKQKNDRTWCFWGKSAYGLEDIQFRHWNKLAVKNDHYTASFDLAPYRYWMVRGIDFYESARRKLAEHDNVVWQQGQVSHVVDAENSAAVLVDGEQINGTWVFDSRPPKLEIDPQRYHYLKQHFTGWLIQTRADSFDTSEGTLFDFRTEQHEQMRFMYVLPCDRHTALVEYTLFSADLLKEEEYVSALQSYLRDVLHLEDYDILEVEKGVIPMSDQPLPRRLGRHVMAIGTRGGRVKPSSGYAFLRIQKDTQAIITALESSGSPFFKENLAWRYPIFDRIMLQVMHRSGGEMANIFTVLFQRNSIERIFQFLDEEGTFWQDLRLIGSLPWVPFLRAVWRLWVVKKINA